jgi:hypothetical protein
MVIRHIRKKSHWYVDHSFFYFCFSFPTLVVIKETTGQAKIDLTISVSDDFEPESSSPVLFRLIAVTKSHLMWKASKIEPIVWKRTEFSQWCAYLYLNETGNSEKGWKRALFDAPNTLEPDLSDWEKEVVSFPIDFKSVMPMFGNGLAFDDDWWTHQQCEVSVLGHGVMLFPTSTEIVTVESMLMSLYGKEARASSTGYLWEVMKERGWRSPLSVTLHDIVKIDPDDDQDGGVVGYPNEEIITCVDCAKKYTGFRLQMQTRFCAKHVNLASWEQDPHG